MEAKLKVIVSVFCKWCKGFYFRQIHDCMNLSKFSSNNLETIKKPTFISIYHMTSRLGVK